MPSTFNMIKALCTSGVALVAIAPMAAHAGFGWTPPPVQQEQVPAGPDAVPVPDVSSGPLTPEPDALPVPMGAAPHTDSLSIVQQELAPPAPAPSPVIEDVPSAPVPLVAPTEKPDVKESVGGMKSLPMKKDDAPAIAPSAPIPAPVAAAPAKDAAIVEGFGKDIPLALALRDIVPSSYAYAFGSNAMAGLKVSWRGGKAWPQVLDAALAPLDLQASVQGNVVMIVARTAIATPSPAVPPSADAAPVPLAVADTPVKQAVPVVDMTVKRKWSANPGTTLRQTLDSWSQQANVELNWSTAYDYPVTNAFFFEGTYGEAVDSLLSSYGGESPAPKGRLYPNLPDGPSVLMIN